LTPALSRKEMNRLSGSKLPIIYVKNFRKTSEKESESFFEKDRKEKV
jgi:hypothetical protein